MIGMRAVDARNGAYLPRAVIELWQTYPGHPWARIGRYIATSAGLVQVTRTPGVTVTYQARLATGTANQAAVSPTLAVKVT